MVLTVGGHVRLVGDGQFDFLPRLQAGEEVNIVLENDELGDAPYVRCGPDGTVVLEFGDDIDLTDLRDELLKEYPLDKYPLEEDE